MQCETRRGSAGTAAADKGEATSRRYTRQHGLPDFLLYRRLGLGFGRTLSGALLGSLRGARMSSAFPSSSLAWCCFRRSPLCCICESATSGCNGRERARDSNSTTCAQSLDRAECLPCRRAADRRRPGTVGGGRAGNRRRYLLVIDAPFRAAFSASALGSLRAPSAGARALHRTLRE